MKKKLLNLYLSKDASDPELDEVIKGWLAEELEDDSFEAIAEEVFNERVMPGTPTKDTYKRLAGLRKKLDFPKRRALRIPLTKRVSFRVAAVLIPAVAALGVYFFLTEYPAGVQEQSTQVSEVVVKPQTIQTVEPIVADSVVEDIIPEDETLAPANEQQPEQKIEPRSTTPRDVRYNIVASATDGTSKYIKLPDNSIAMLKEGTQLSFSSEKREAHVTGEAFFDVAKGNPKPFRVITDCMAINVTGTKFNVRAWSGEKSTVVDLLEGSVDVNAGASPICLQPMEQLTLNNTSGVVRMGRAERDGWWNELIGFDAHTLSQILNTLEGYYDVSIVGKEKLTSQTLYTVKFERMSSIEHVMEILKRICVGFDYACEKNIVKVNVQNTSGNNE